METKVNPLNLCHECKRPAVKSTNQCVSYNPIFNCFYAKQNYPHTHYYCACGYSWIRVGRNADFAEQVQADQPSLSNK